MLKAVLAAGTAALLWAAPGQAAVPVISGTYAMAFTGICQAEQTGVDGGLIESYSESAKFDSSTGVVKIAGNVVQGLLVVWSGQSTGYQQQAFSASYSYSNTATTVTIGGTTYNVVYGPVKKGIVQSAVYNGVDANGCAVTGTALRK